jgi:ferritin-like metal-binding protein YciE
MTTEAIEHLKDWLRDAHAMEQQAESMLQAQADRLDHYPVLRARIVEHIEETRWQRDQLEGCLSRLDSSPSLVKDMGGRMMAFGQAMAGMMMTDEVVKGSMASYVFENIEIATYTVLIAAAGMAGDERPAVIVITGATSGIGLTTARMAARKGAKLVLAARDHDALDQLVSELKRYGADALAVPTDVGMHDEVAALGSAAIQRFGRIDTWVNNAGISIYGRNQDVPLVDQHACSRPISGAWCTAR